MVQMGRWFKLVNESMVQYQWFKWVDGSNL